MKTRIIAAAVIVPVALAILLIFPAYILALTVAFIVAVAAYELFGAVNKICKKMPSPRAAVYAIIAAVMVPFTVYFDALIREQGGFDDTTVSIVGTGNIQFIGILIIFFIIMCLVLVDFFLSVKSEKRIRLPQLLITPAAALVIPYMLASLIGLRMMPNGRFLVMIPIIVTVFTDSGAYFTGVAIGKHKPMPAISPNKTTEGFIGGIFAGIAAVLAYGLILSAAFGLNVNYPAMLLYGFAGAVITECGDLIFSLIKRKCGIKDYGSMIPGHGGMLDRFDSMIFSSPIMYALVLLLPAVT